MTVKAHDFQNDTAIMRTIPLGIATDRDRSSLKFLLLRHESSRCGAPYREKLFLPRE